MNTAKLDAELERKNLEGYWNVRARGHKADAPHLWKWADLHDGLMQASEQIGFEFSDESLQTIPATDVDAFDGYLLRYVNPATSGYTLPTMSCEVQLLKPRMATRFHRHTSTVLCFVFKGRGRTRIGEGCLEWEKGDCFVIPHWQWHGHETGDDDEAILFSINDKPISEALSLYREEAWK